MSKLSLKSSCDIILIFSSLRPKRSKSSKKDKSKESKETKESKELKEVEKEQKTERVPSSMKILESASKISIGSEVEDSSGIDDALADLIENARSLILTGKSLNIRL